MRFSIYTLILSAFCLAVGPAYADSTDRYRDALYIIVVTDEEAIHYAQHCGFYELRELLAESVGNISDSIDIADTPIFEIRVLGKSGETKASVGDHWIRTEDGAALITSATYERILESVERRKGEGGPKSTASTSVQRILGRIQDSAYVEQNLCSN